jgi:hypothetical protein
VYDKHVKEALDSLGVHDVYDFLLVKNNDILSSSAVPDQANPLILLAARLLPITVRRILKQWYSAQKNTDHTTWFQPTPEAINH